MTESLTRDMYEQLVRGIAESRRKRVEDVRALIDDGPFLARDAHGAVWSTCSHTKTSLTTTARSARPARRGGYYGRTRAIVPRGAPRVAVLYVSGIINSGDSGFDPLNGDVAGSLGLVKAIRSARADDMFARLCAHRQPGGSSIASDVIWRELTVTKNEKPSRPLVASMSDLAASGGYYVAMAASQIVAQPATLTGSIGIYGGSFITGGAFEKAGANLSRSSSGATQEWNRRRPFTDSERQKLASRYASFYDGFIQKVAASRKMPV